MRTIWCDSVQPDMSSNFDRAVGGGVGGSDRGGGEAGPRAPLGAQGGPTVAGVLGEEARGIEQPQRPSGCEDPDGHQRGVKRL